MTEEPLVGRPSMSVTLYVNKTVFIPSRVGYVTRRLSVSNRLK